MRPFVSHLAADLEAFLEFKHSRGCKYVRAELWLRAFDRYVSEQGLRPRGRGLGDLISAWLGRNGARSPVTVANEFIVLRKFCEFRRRHDPKAFVPTDRWVSQSSESKFRPYIFTREQVSEVLRLTKAMTRPPFRAALYRALLLLLFCTGIRIGEAIRLRIRDVDLDDGVLYIAESKGRARWVPCHSSLVRELRRYLEERRDVAPAGLASPFFIGAGGKGLVHNTTSEAVRSLFRSAGIKPLAGRSGPRIHDLRHTFAVHRLARWYRAGVDVQGRLPLLSTYMGHESVLGTEKYLTATPELLEMAARRLRLRLAQSRERT